jgi:LacI family transcriptional regulator
MAVRCVTPPSYAASAGEARILLIRSLSMKALTRSRRAVRRSGPTIYQVAERAGVSIATVSRVHRQADRVAPRTRDRVRQAIDELSYRPSRLGRSLAHGSHDAIGVVFPDLSGPYFSTVILGYEEATSAGGRSVMILGTHGRPGSVDQVLNMADRVDGLVVMSQTIGDDIVEELERRRVPVVLLARPPAGAADSVRTENRHTAATLVRHLIDHGHRSIAFLGDPRGSADAGERWQGFLDAHRDAGIDPALDPIACGYRELDGRVAGARVLARPGRPTAIVGANDEIALGALDAARAHGIRVPDELAITGWDDIPMSRHTHPALTTVRQPMLDLGRRAAALLDERISTNRTEPRHEVLPTELVVRSSCGCKAPTNRKEE